MDLTSIPPELLREIAFHLNLSDISNFSLSLKRFNDALCASDVFWMLKLRIDFEKFRGLNPEKSAKGWYRDLFKFSELQEWFVSILGIDATIDKLKAIEKMSLSTSSDFPIIRDETKIWYFNIEKELEFLPDSFGNLNSLQSLNLYCNNLESLPESFGNLSSLKFLHLECNKLKHLPESFGNLVSLKFLNLSYNNLGSEGLPDSFGNLNSLQSLNLSCNNLRSEGLPDSFGNLNLLQFLFLDDNKLTSLPDSFGNLNSLQFLDLSYNDLESLPDSFGNLNSLQSLNLYGNDLRSKGLPDSFGNLNSLQSLYLSNNKLTSLPESFGNLNSLRSLDLSYSDLESLPESFENLSSLEKLDLNNNKFKSLPESFGNLKDLRNLNLTHNDELKSLPKSFKNLSCLQILFYSGQLKSPPEIIKKFAYLEREQYKNYISNMIKQTGATPKNEDKCKLIGELYEYLMEYPWFIRSEIRFRNATTKKAIDLLKHPNLEKSTGQILLKYLDKFN